MATKKVDKWYGVGLADRLKFTWLDASFAIERGIEKMRREHCAASAKDKNNAEKKSAENKAASKKCDCHHSNKEVEIAGKAGENEHKNRSRNATIVSEVMDNGSANNTEVHAHKHHKGGDRDKSHCRHKKSCNKTETEEDQKVSSQTPEKKVATEETIDTKPTADEEIEVRVEPANQDSSIKPVPGFNIGNVSFSSVIDDNPDAGTAPAQTSTASVPQAIQNPIINTVQNPVHRVDAPPKIIPPKPTRTPQDVELSGIDVAKTFVDPTMVQEKVTPSIIDKEKHSVPPVEIEPAFDNTGLISKYPYLENIQNVALKCNVQLKMLMLGSYANPAIPIGIIHCVAHMDGGIVNELKSFTIDTGNIIDRRPKVFPGLIFSGFETVQSYPVQLPDKNSKGKNVFNEELFNKILIGGTTSLEPRGMYSPAYRKLNEYVDLITMPTREMNGERRKAVQDRLLKAMDAGVFARALDTAPGSRFAFKPGSYDKEKGSFVLTNENVPARFNMPVCNSSRLEIIFGGNKQVFLQPVVEDSADK